MAGSWPVGTGTISVELAEGKVKLIGTKHELSVAAELNPTEVEYLKKFTKHNAEKFDSNYSKDSNQSALKEAIQYARLHAAFLGTNSRPIDAANQLMALIRRSKAYNPYLKVSVRETMTQQERIENIRAMSSGLTGLAQMHERNQLGPAMREYQDRQERDAGERLLRQMLGEPPPGPSIEEVITATEQKLQRDNPNAVEIVLEYGHDSPAILHIERHPQGGLRVSPQAGVGFKVNSLKEVVDWLQGKGFSGKEYDWRTYENIESTQFRP